MRFRLSLITCVVAAGGCASSPPPSPGFDTAEATLALQDDEAPVDLDGTYETYVEHALGNRPELKASLERWRAARYRTAAVDAMPPLQVGYGFYIQSVETRVGPQRHRLDVQQPIPWPGKASAAEDVATARAAVAEERFSSMLLDVRWQVAEAFWRVWEVERHHFWHDQHQEIVRAVADSIRGRVEVGRATIADVGQAELLISRTVDDAAEAAEMHRRASFDLARATGLPAGQHLDVVAPQPRARVPAESDQALIDAATATPEVRAISRMQEVAREEAALATRSRYPDFGVGAQWIETGQAIDPSMPDSGKDPVIASLSVKIPLWAGETFAAEDAARADEVAWAAEEEAARRDARAAVLDAIAAIRDSARRVLLYQSTLIPQAEAVLGSVRGAYEVGDIGVAPLLMAQNELLELRLALAKNRAAHERQWARLERLVARPVATKDPS